MTPFPPKPHPAFEHPTLGSFVFEDGIWTAQIPQGTNSLELSLAGNDSGPPERLIEAAIDLLARFAQVKEQALDFLIAQEEAPNREDFICHGMQLLLDDYPNHFSLTFILFGDLGGSWRVEFEDGAPEFLARDD